MFLDDLSGALLVVERKQDLVEARITLAVVEEVDELHTANGVRLSFGSTNHKAANHSTFIVGQSALNIHSLLVN